MGGGHHEPFKVPDWKIYNNYRAFPELVEHERRLAMMGLKDPWIRFVKKLNRHFIISGQWTVYLASFYIDLRFIRSHKSAFCLTFECFFFAETLSGCTINEIKVFGKWLRNQFSPVLALDLFTQPLLSPQPKRTCILKRNRTETIIMKDTATISRKVTETNRRKDTKTLRRKYTKAIRRKETVAATIITVIR